MLDDEVYFVKYDPTPYEEGGYLPGGASFPRIQIIAMVEGGSFESGTVIVGKVSGDEFTVTNKNLRHNSG